MFFDGIKVLKYSSKSNRKIVRAAREILDQTSVSHQRQDRTSVQWWWHWSPPGQSSLRDTTSFPNHRCRERPIGQWILVSSMFDSAFDYANDASEGAVRRRSYRTESSWAKTTTPTTKRYFSSSYNSLITRRYEFESLIFTDNSPAMQMAARKRGWNSSIVRRRVRIYFYSSTWLSNHRLSVHRRNRFLWSRQRMSSWEIE